MKNLFLGLFSFILFAGCNDDDKKPGAVESNPIQTDNANKTNDAALSAPDKENMTTVEWLDTHEQNMGKIAEGQKLEVKFRFKNTGTKPLVISKVWAQCGCTVPETPKEPFAPGQEGVIKAIFDSQGRGGSSNTKEVYVNANTDPTTNVLVFKVDVTKKDN